MLKKIFHIPTHILAIVWGIAWNVQFYFRHERNPIEAEVESSFMFRLLSKNESLIAFLIWILLILYFTYGTE